MPNPEKLKNQEPSEEVIQTPNPEELKAQELSEKEEIIEDYQGEVEDFRAELPITKEEGGCTISCIGQNQSITNYQLNITKL